MISNMTYCHARKIEMLGNRSTHILNRNTFCKSNLPSIIDIIFEVLNREKFFEMMVSHSIAFGLELFSDTK